MGFFDSLRHPIRTVQRAAGAYPRHSLGEQWGMTKKIFDPRLAKWWLAGGKNPLYPAPPSPADLQTTDPDQARTALDSLMGFDPADRSQALAIQRLRDGGGLTRAVEAIIPDGWEPTTPFSILGKSQMATSNLNSFRDPYFVLDNRLSSILSDNPGIAASYMRETDPVKMLGVLIEQDSRKVSGGNSSTLKDIGGRILGTPKAIFASAFGGIQGRTEELLGYIAYNDIPDLYLRKEMGKHYYDTNLSFWGLLAPKDKDAAPLRKVDELLASGKYGQQAADELQAWFKDNSDLGNMLANMVGQTVFDPLWLLPMADIGKVVTAPIKAVTGAEKIGLLARLGTPAGREVAGKFGIRSLMEMPELAYAEKKLASPAKGVTSWFFKKPPTYLAEAMQARSGLPVFITANTISDGEGLANFALDINATLKEGKLTGMVADRIPGLFEDPDIADFVQIAKQHGKDVFNEETINTFRGTGEGIWNAAPQAEKIAAFKQIYEHNIRMIGLKEGDRVWSGFKGGKFLTHRLMPFNRAQQSVISMVGLNTPGFAWLQIPSNFFHVGWTAFAHPLRYGKSLSWSLMAELGGKYPEGMARSLRPLGLIPLDVEMTVSRQSGARELFDVGGFGSAKAIDVAAEAGVEAKAMDELQRALGSPTRHVGQPFRWRDVLSPWTNVATHLDVLFRRSAFFAALPDQAHLATSVMDDRLIPAFKHLLVDGGMDPVVAKNAEGTLRDHLYSKLVGKTPLDSTATGVLDDAEIDHSISHVLAQLGDLSSLSGVRSGVGYAEDYASAVKGITSGHELDAAIRDIRPMADYLSNEILPRLGSDLSGKEAATILRSKVDEFYDAADVIRQMGGMESVARPANNYTSHFRNVDKTFRAEMADTVDTTERYLRTQFFGDDGWARMGAGRKYHAAAQQATVENLNNLKAIRGIYDRFAQEQGLTRIAGDTVIPWVEDLPEAIQAGTIGEVWANYFEVRNESWKNFFDESRALVEGNAPAHEALGRLQDSLDKTFEQHQKILSEVPKRMKELDSIDQAWAEASNKVQALYTRNYKKRPALLSPDLKPNDPVRMMEMMDYNGPLAQEMSDFVEWTIPQLRKDLASLKTGQIKVGMSPERVFQDTAKEIKNRLPQVRQVVAANARAQVDFAMLNYNNQYGFDHVMKTIVPFSFWPTRQAANWGLRAARNPGAFAGVVLAMTQPKKYMQQHGYPDRLSVKIPIYMPFLDDFLDKMPYVGDRLRSGDFAPYYFIDPMRMLFPMKYLTNTFDDPQKRNTLPGRVLDFFENYTAMSISPFAKTIGAETGALDKDAWRSYGFQGGPFGIPLTETARITGKWLYEGDDTAIPTAEQQIYAERGYFSKGWIGRILGLEPGKFDVYRAERALGSLLATGELLPGEPKEKQAEAAWLALDAHKGTAWKNAVKAAESEQFQQRLTGYIGFPFGPVTGINQGEVINLGLKALYSEAARKGQLDQFFEKYPEYEIKTVVAKGISDPKEKAQAIDTELYYRGIDKYGKQFEPAEQQLGDALTKLRGMEQSLPVREQIDLVETQLQGINSQKSDYRDMLERAFPEWNHEASLNHDPRDRALNMARSDYYDLNWDKSKETYEAFQARKEAWINQFPDGGDPVAQESFWHEKTVESSLIKLSYGRQIEQAIQNEDFDKLQSLTDERDGKLEAIHEEAQNSLSRRDVLRYLASFNKPKTPEQQEFEQADSLFDLWHTLTGRDSAFTSHEKTAISAYFKSLPEMQKYFPLDVVSYSDLTVEQKLAIMRRKEFWRTYHAISDPETQLDYFYMVGRELNQANQVLGLPSATPIDVTAQPPEYGSDSMFAHVEMMAALNQRDAMSQDPSMSQPDQAELQRLLSSYGTDSETFGSMTGDQVDELISSIAY